jgi:transposase
MRRKSVPEKEPATLIVKNIRRATRRHFSAEDKIRIVLVGLRGEDSIAELCRSAQRPGARVPQVVQGSNPRYRSSDEWAAIRSVSASREMSILVIAITS